MLGLKPVRQLVHGRGGPFGLALAHRVLAHIDPALEGSRLLAGLLHCPVRE